MTKTLNFISSLPIDECVNRLASWHQEPTVFAIKGQKRIDVRLQQVDMDTYHFTFQQVNKSSLSGTSSHYVRGKLQATTDGQTYVFAEHVILYPRIIFFSLALGAICGIAFVSSTLDSTGLNSPRETLLFFFVTIGVAAGLLLLQGNIFTRDNQMIEHIKSTLNYHAERKF